MDVYDRAGREFYILAIYEASVPSNVMCYKALRRLLGLILH